MDNQTQKTILISLIVALITTVPFAILVSYLTMMYFAPDMPSTMAPSSVSQALEQADKRVEKGSVSENADEPKSVASPPMQNEVLVANKQTSQTEAGRLAITRTIFTTDKASYTLSSEFIQKDGQPYKEQSILRTDLSTGEEAVWIKDLKSLDTTGSLKSNEEFIIFSNPKQGEDLYLEVIPGGGTELIGMDVYKFAINEQILTKLSVSSQLRNNFGAYAISPNGVQVLLAPPTSQTGLDQDLLLIDLEQDTSKRLFSLTQNETFNAGANGLLVFTAIRWVDNENFVYDVYDQSLKPKNPDLTSEAIEKILIEQRSHSLSVK